MPTEQVNGEKMSSDSKLTKDLVRENFSRISQQIAELQVSHAEWKRYVTARRDLDGLLENRRAAMAILYAKVVVSFALACLLFTLLFLAVFEVGAVSKEGPLGAAHRALAGFYVEYVDGAQLANENCILPFMEPLQDLFRPPVDCGMCVNVTAIDARTELTLEEFRARYAYSSRPLVVTDGMEGWTAVDTFSFEYFKEVYTPGSKALVSVENDCQFFPYRTSFETLGEVFNMTEDEAYLRSGDNAKPWYIGWSNCDSSAANLLRKHYDKPYFLPEDSESSKVDWIFMGSPGYGAPNHIDAVDLPSWQAQVKGHKVWTLNPPPECYFECGGEMSVTLHPGYIVIVDTNSWFHSTKVIGEEMSITIGSEYD